MVRDAATVTNVLSELTAGKAFDGLVRQYSIAPRRDAGGELPWVSLRTPATEGKTSGLPVAIALALDKLPAGAVTPGPIPVDGVRAIVKLDANWPTQVPASNARRQRSVSRSRRLRWKRRMRSSSADCSRTHRFSNRTSHDRREMRHMKAT